MNFAKFSKELPPAANAKQLQEIISIRLKAKVLQGDIEAVVRAISELSEIENNIVKVKIRIERLSEHRVAYVQFRDRLISGITRRRGNRGWIVLLEGILGCDRSGFRCSS